MRFGIQWMGVGLGSLWLVACGGATAEPDALTKAQAAAARSAGDTRDSCAARGWYGDGVCDTFCLLTDTDCIPDGSGDPIVCATFVEPSDGVCRRAAQDACRFQDPDCTPPSTGGGSTGAGGGRPTTDGGSTPGGSSGSGIPSTGGGNTGSGTSGGTGNSVDPVAPSSGGGGAGGNTGSPVACADVLEPSDKLCTRDPADPCRAQDPDCSVSSPPQPPVLDCDVSHVSCRRAQPECPAGQVVTVENGCFGPCVDAKWCGSVPPVPKPRGELDCDVRNVTCQTFAPVICPDGQVPSVLDGCYGPCVPSEKCAPVACLAIAELPDGACGRELYDPCRGQDPDCAPYGQSFDCVAATCDMACPKGQALAAPCQCVPEAECASASRI